MSTGLIYETVSIDSSDTERLGELFGRFLKPPLVIELRSDLGGGKTTFVRGLARGVKSNDTVSSPTFTISRVYKFKNGEIHHFDFYRLDEAGVMADQLKESLDDKEVVTVVEWSDIVQSVLPDDRITIGFSPTANDPEERRISISYTEKNDKLIKQLETEREQLRP